MSPRVSIAMAYRDRKAQLVRTLRSIAASALASEVEVVVADDASRPEERVEELAARFSFPLHVVRLDPADRWWVNPCVSFNRAIGACQGELLVVQNPECLHLGDVLADAVSRVGAEDYVAYSCYSLDRPTTEGLDEIPSGAADAADRSFVDRVRERVGPLRPRAIGGEGELGWYNHGRHRPVAYHFCAALPRARMEELGGFDQRYAHGVGFDDDELLARVRRLGLRVAIVDEPCVLHQWHYTAGGFGGLGDTPRGREDFRRNEALYRTATLTESGWKANEGVSL